MRTPTPLRTSAQTRALRRGAQRSILAFALVASSSFAKDPAPAEGRSTSAKPGPAPSAAQPIEGYVLAIEAGDLIVDLGSNRGASLGAHLELWRPLRLVHPVTRRVVTDRYRIGSIVLEQVRPAISLGKLDDTPLRAPAPGDIVVAAPAAHQEVLPGPPTAPTTAPPPNTVTLPETEMDREANDVGALFDALHGQSLSARISAYERYAGSQPHGRFSGVLLEEAAALRELVRARQRGEPGPDEARAPSFEPPLGTTAGAPVTLGIELGGNPAGAILESRNAGEVAYRSTPMVVVGPGYYAATLPGERVRDPAIEYFVEAVGADGLAAAAVGSADQPLRLPIGRVPTASPPLRQENTVTVVTDYADYNRLRGNDYTWQTEGTFAMRFDDVGVRAVRSGFGVYRGVGGSVYELDDLRLAPRSVGLTYGHLEGEFGISPVVSLIARAVLGLGDSGTTGGAQLHVRIGSDRTTNLLIGGEVLGGIGLRGITELDLDPRGRVPIVIRSEVTNQPVGTTKTDVPAALARTESTSASAIGIRGILQVGYRLAPPFVLSARASYEGRTIDHAGPGFGGAMEYRW